MKKLLIFALFGAMVCAAKADYSNVSLCWCISGSLIDGSFSYAMLKYTLDPTIGTETPGYLGVSTDNEGTSSEYTKVGANDGGMTTDSVYSWLGGKDDWSGYTFVAEAYDAKGNILGSSHGVSIEQLASGLSTDMAPAGPYAFTVIPEPTSGLLLLLGVAGLALKRKKVVSC